jgi:hypothetical protein
MLPTAPLAPRTTTRSSPVTGESRCAECDRGHRVGVVGEFDHEIVGNGDSRCREAVGDDPAPATLEVDPSPVVGTPDGFDPEDVRQGRMTAVEPARGDRDVDRVERDCGDVDAGAVRVARVRVGADDGRFAELVDEGSTHVRWLPARRS